MHGRVLGVQPARRGQLLVAAGQLDDGPFGRGQGVRRQRGGGRGFLARLLELPQAVSAQGLQHRVAGPPVRAGRGRRQQRAVDQVQDRGPGVRPGHSFGGLQAERPGEHRQAPEDALLGFCQ